MGGRTVAIQIFEAIGNYKKIIIIKEYSKKLFSYWWGLIFQIENI